ncbi:MAG TPA: tRNA (adenosine(37)-N6)-threonylcarbamoyltransferase complex transferase subunit TsaD [Gaiellales bacterium]
MILALETSCDDTCAAVVDLERVVRSSVRSSQSELHDRFGGVVPEVASRRHLELVTPVVERALEDAGVTLDEITLVAATQGPGLIGALLVGLAAGKAIAWARGLPFAPVDHLRGHVAALSLAPMRVEPPFLCLLASGGHTLFLDVPEPGELIPLGGTLDDAAGEAFDKGARLLGLPYPGGPALEQLAREGDPAREPFPRALAGRAGCDLSFSGLKSALARRVGELGEAAPAARADLAAGYQEAIVATLVERAGNALDGSQRSALAVAGGVASNGALREALARMCARRGVELLLAPGSLCVDNAAMIASAALDVEPLDAASYLALDAYARSPVLRRLHSGR